MIPGSYESDRPLSITGLDKILFMCDCINGSKVNGVREHILSSFALGKPSIHKVFKEPRSKLFKKINKTLLSHITSYLEDDDHKKLHFNGDTICLTFQLIKIY